MYPFEYTADFITNSYVQASPERNSRPHSLEPGRLAIGSQVEGSEKLPKRNTEEGGPLDLGVRSEARRRGPIGSWASVAADGLFVGKQFAKA
jgi:hypothetical protein